MVRWPGTVGSVTKGIRMRFEVRIESVVTFTVEAEERAHVVASQELLLAEAKKREPLIHVGVGRPATGPGSPGSHPGVAEFTVSYQPKMTAVKGSIEKGIRDGKV